MFETRLTKDGLALCFSIQNAGLNRNRRRPQLGYYRTLSRWFNYPSYWGYVANIEIAPD